MWSRSLYMRLALSLHFFAIPKISASPEFYLHEHDTNIATYNPYEHARTPVMRPHWISGSNKFWFRESYTSEDSTFIYIDPSQRLRKPAFDHAKVAEALREQGVDASATNLPFAWIDVSDDLALVKFRAGERSWEWTDDGVLAPAQNDILEDDTNLLKPLTEEHYTTQSSKESKIQFINRTKWKISLYWIDQSGRKKYYRTVESGRMAVQHTYEGHIWRAVKARNEDVVASFAAGSEEKTAIIEQGLPVPKPLPPARNNLTKRQNNETTDGSGVFFKNNNVWFRDLTGKETQMSTTGTEDSPFTNYTYLGPDNQFAVVFQTTPGQQHTIYEVESSPNDQVQPRLHQLQYLKPGDNVTIDRPRMFDLTKKREILTDNTLFANPYQINAINGGWNHEATEFRFFYNQRGHQVLRIVSMNTKGDVRVLVEENSTTFVDYSSKLYYREITTSNSSELIWASERDGWNHLYLYDLNSGKLRNQITKGEWVVRSVDYVDVEKRQVWLKVFGAVPGQDPYYAHLARVNFDGTGFKILTEGDGTHSWYFSEDRSTFTDTWSRMDLAEHTVTRDAVTGDMITEVSAGNLDYLLWPIPERFAAPGRDGSTLIYGLIFRPYGMDNNTKYPVIEKIYAGPQDFYVPKAYQTHVEAHQLANKGFVVVLIDGMGTNWRSKAFHDVCHKNLKDAGFPDRIAWMKAAASTRRWMDIDRVGVYGGSAGGQNAMGALLFHNEFYSVAAADCGCHDNRMDKIWWNEAWMGYPVDQSYEDSSNVVNAGKLKGSLLLSVGELDTNVDPASTMQVVNALNNANKDYELVFIPGGGHGVGSTNAYALRRTQDFLYRNLKGTEPPQSF